MRYIDQFENIKVIMEKGYKLPTIYVNDVIVPIYLNKKEGNPKRYFVVDAINTKTKKKNQVLVHRIVAELLVKKEDKNDDRIVFLDGNRHNYHPDNLKWTTSSKEMIIMNKNNKKKIKEKELKKKNRINKKNNNKKKDYKKFIIGISIGLLIGVGYIIFKFM